MFIVSERNKREKVSITPATRPKNDRGTGYDFSRLEGRLERLYEATNNMRSEIVMLREQDSSKPNYVIRTVDNIELRQMVDDGKMKLSEL